MDLGLGDFMFVSFLISFLLNLSFTILFFFFLMRLMLGFVFFLYSRL
jgi:hypothetical protein